MDARALLASYAGSKGFDAIDVEAEVESDNPDYDFMFSYTVEEETYTIYYNFDEETNESVGILISGDITYDLEIEDNLKDDGEGESKRNLILTATNGDNWITIDYEEKIDGEESKTNLTTKLNEIFQRWSTTVGGMIFRPKRTFQEKKRIKLKKVFVQLIGVNVLFHLLVILTSSRLIAQQAEIKFEHISLVGT